MPSVHTRHPARPRARWGAESYYGPPPRLRRRHVRAGLARWPVGLYVWKVWLALVTVAVAFVLFELSTGLLVPGGDRGPLGLVLITLGFVWGHGLLCYQVRRREVLAWPHAGRQAAVRVTDPLGTDLLVAIGDLERVLLAALHEEGVVAAVPTDELTMVRMIATRAVGALRELRDQTIALGRAVAVTMPPDRDRLAGARETVRLRLMRGMRDCTELAVVASTPDADDFRPRFAAAATRLTALVADVKPLLH